MADWKDDEIGNEAPLSGAGSVSAENANSGDTLDGTTAGVPVMPDDDDLYDEDLDDRGNKSGRGKSKGGRGTSSKKSGPLGLSLAIWAALGVVIVVGGGGVFYFGMSSVQPNSPVMEPGPSAAAPVAPHPLGSPIINKNSSVSAQHSGGISLPLGKGSSLMTPATVAPAPAKQTPVGGLALTSPVVSASSAVSKSGSLDNSVINGIHFEHAKHSAPTPSAIGTQPATQISLSSVPASVPVASPAVETKSNTSLQSVSNVKSKEQDAKIAAITLKMAKQKKKIAQLEQQLSVLNNEKTHVIVRTVVHDVDVPERAEYPVSPMKQTIGKWHIVGYGNGMAFLSGRGGKKKTVTDGSTIDGGVVTSIHNGVVTTTNGVIQ